MQQWNMHVCCNYSTICTLSLSVCLDLSVVSLRTVQDRKWGGCIYIYLLMHGYYGSMSACACMVALFSQRGEQEGLHACWIYCCEEEERDRERKRWAGEGQGRRGEGRRGLVGLPWPSRKQRQSKATPKGKQRKAERIWFPPSWVTCAYQDRSKNPIETLDHSLPTIPTPNPIRTRAITDWSHAYARMHQHYHAASLSFDLLAS